MDYSPKLKAAMGEIKDILKKYDCGAIVVIHTPGHTEYMKELTPSYSCVKIEANQTLRIRARLKEDYGGDREKFNASVAGTASMLRGLGDVGGLQAMEIMELSDLLDREAQIQYRDLGHTPDSAVKN